MRMFKEITNFACSVSESGIRTRFAKFVFTAAALMPRRSSAIKGFDRLPMKTKIIMALRALLEG